MTPFEASGIDARSRAEDRVPSRHRHGRDRKAADLVVFDADPLADIHNSVKIRWVIKNGESSTRRRWRGDGRRSAAAQDVLAGGAMSERAILTDRSRRSQCPRIAARDSGGDRDDRSIARRRGARSGRHQASGPSPRSWSTWRRPRSSSGPVPLRAGDRQLRSCSRSTRTGSWPSSRRWTATPRSRVCQPSQVRATLDRSVDCGRAGEALPSSRSRRDLRGLAARMVGRARAASPRADRADCRALRGTVPLEMHGGLSPRWSERCITSASATRTAK